MEEEVVVEEENVVEDIVVEDVEEEEDEAEEEERERIRLFPAIANFTSSRYFSCTIPRYSTSALVLTRRIVGGEGKLSAKFHRYPRHPPLLYRKIRETRRRCRRVCRCYLCSRPIECTCETAC